MWHLCPPARSVIADIKPAIPAPKIAISICAIPGLQEDQQQTVNVSSSHYSQNWRMAAVLLPGASKSLSVSDWEDDTWIREPMIPGNGELNIQPNFTRFTGKHIAALFPGIQGMLPFPILLGHASPGSGSKRVQAWLGACSA